MICDKMENVDEIRHLPKSVKYILTQVLTLHYYIGSELDKFMLKDSFTNLSKLDQTMEDVLKSLSLEDYITLTCSSYEIDDVQGIDVLLFIKTPSEFARLVKQLFYYIVEQIDKYNLKVVKSKSGEIALWNLKGKEHPLKLSDILEAIY